MSWRSMAMGAGLLAACWGCAPFDHAAAPLPSRYAVVLDSVVFHSDGQLPPQSQLFDELLAQRRAMAQTLRLSEGGPPLHVYLHESQKSLHRCLRDAVRQLPERRAYFVRVSDRLEVHAAAGPNLVEDLRHEMAHGFLHAAVANVPLWLDEGIAEYFELPEAATAVHWEHVDRLADLLGAGVWQPNLSRLEAVEDPSQLTETDYAEAWAWTWWLLRAPQAQPLLQAYLSEANEGGAPPLSQRILAAVPDAAGQLARGLSLLRRHSAG
jgi:Protein of unknown function (DUF1570)